jgi:hypothetical protein
MLLVNYVTKYEFLWRSQTFLQKKSIYWVWVWTQTQTKINLDLDSEFKSIHFGIDKRLKFLAPISFWV